MWQFYNHPFSVRPCTLTADDIYFEDTDESEECFEDEDDSNDENNWRNDYPEEIDSEKGLYKIAAVSEIDKSFTFLRDINDVTDFIYFLLFYFNKFCAKWYVTFFWVILVIHVWFCNELVNYSCFKKNLLFYLFFFNVLFIFTLKYL